MTTRPTESATAKFKQAMGETKRAVSASVQSPGHDGPYNVLLAQAVMMLAEGLSELSVGLRATYILIDQMERQQRLKRP
jgi:hypothetical protein